jgi:hypothetical protein
MSRASDWTKVKQNDIRRQVIRAERDQRLHDAEYSPHPDDPPPVNWALERWRARMAKKYRLAQQSTPAAPRPSRTWPIERGKEAKPLMFNVCRCEGLHYMMVARRPPIP